MTRFIRFKGPGLEPAYGLLEGDRIRELHGDIFGEFSPGGRSFAVSEVTTLAPVTPSKIVCVGRNYVAHAAELGNSVPDEPLIFMKPPTAVIGPGQPIVFPDGVGQVDYEGELAVVIGRKAHRVPVAEASDYILGYTCLDDVSARTLQKKDKAFTRAKGFDTFCPLGPWISTGLNPEALTIRTRVNGELRQDCNTQLMIFHVPTLLAFISRIMTLLPGDVIATGTPAGVGPLCVGDTVEVEIEGIGVLTNPVVAEPPAG